MLSKLQFMPDSGAVAQIEILIRQNVRRTPFSNSGMLVEHINFIKSEAKSR
jgi:hypothetical protein